MKYIIGLDVGIGSVGWAVIKNETNCKRIEDFGVRIFDSGETIENNNQKRKSQIRREYRGTRRQIRRRHQRKERLKNFLQNIGLVSKEEITQFFSRNDHDIIDIRVRALDSKISSQELAAALLYIAKHRGYKPFYYENDEKSEEGKMYAAVSLTSKIITDGNYRSIAEAIMKDTEHFSETTTGRYKYRNSKNKKDILFPREMYEQETRKILQKQKDYYNQLTDENIEKIFEIIFTQRDFEDGPGDVHDTKRPYKGFSDTIGNCPFYTDEKRGCRFTVTGDLFALVNKLSQYKYVDIETGEVKKLPENLTESIVNFSLQNGQITKAELNSIAKKHGIEILNPETSKNENIADCFKFLKIVKPIFEKHGFVWEDLIGDCRNLDSLLDLDSLLNRIGRTVSYNITPSRRVKRLNNIEDLKGRDELITDIAKQKFSGTANVSNKYMTEAIKAFFKGTLSGEFQAQFIKNTACNSDNGQKSLELPPFDHNNEYAKNPVVFRAINETRKVVNAIIKKYGAPNAMNIEVASELNKSFKTRDKISKTQNDNEKKRKNDVKEVAEILGISESEVTAKQVERYNLGELQDWECMYSGEKITDKREAIKNENKKYEVDHIIPFSKILDNTLNNKALVLVDENQLKLNRAPLMYLTGEKRKAFISRVNKLYKNKKISKIKYGYLMLNSLSDKESKKILNDWKTRNLNDTRYIAKFLVEYFKNNLKFERESGDAVYAVKGAITSSLRRQWLNKETWGNYDKGKLKKITYFDHAVDAIVIANCLPEYVIIAAEKKKLRDIYYSAGKKINDEYNKSLENCVDSLYRFYGISPDISKSLLGNVKETPSLIKNLRLEVEYRVRDFELMRYFIEGAEEKSEEELEKLFRQDLRKLYNDKNFADSIQMPIISIKPERKLSGEVTKANPVKKSKAKDSFYIKTIGDNNTSCLDNSAYYCAEVYTTKTGTTNLFGIRRTDIVRKDKKLYLKPDFKYPEDYGRHVMYLFKGDYIEISKTNKKTDTEKIKRRGFYLSIKCTNQNCIYITKGNSSRKLNNVKENETCAIAQKDRIRKYYIDILGKKGGEIKECGEPLSLLPENGST